MTCRRRKTRCAGEKPICSTCSKNGHQCLGYGDIPDKPPKKEPGISNGVAGLRNDRGDASDTNLDHDDEYYDEAEEDEDERRHWKGKNGSVRGMHRGPSDADARRGSLPAVLPSPGRPRERSRDEHDDSSSARRTAYTSRRPSYSEDGRSSSSRSPVQHHTESRKVPYFRYFGPTAIVPGYKQMVVNVAIHRDRRRSRGGSMSTTSPGSLLGFGPAHDHPLQGETVFESIDDLPTYDPIDPAPTHPVILSLFKTFFLHLGCNYPFLREKKCIRMLKDKTLEPILVDAMCALAARFSDLPVVTAVTGPDEKMKRFEYGELFARRAKTAVADTFPCPSVSTVQAYLLLAYEAFGANQDSALWMYLGLAIRMALDVGLQTKEGITYQGGRDPWYTRNWARKTSSENGDAASDHENEDDTLSPEEQHELEQERVDTFWCVFILDRVISSGTGRPVSLREGDFELPLPAPMNDPVTGAPAPFPIFMQIIHLYGRVSDVLNKIRTATDLTPDMMGKLAAVENELTEIYQKQDPRLSFSVQNFQDYVKLGQGTTFILLHFWFHALIIIIHQPFTLFGSSKRPKLLPNSRELSMSSAKTIADILAFAELIDPKSFIGNPFTSQPMYIAACAFLMDSAAASSEPASREGSPSAGQKSDATRNSAPRPAPTRHSLLASTANQNYQRCYNSLQQLQAYWGGVGYILTALDQRSKGIWDCETFTSEEWESARLPRRRSLTRLARFENQGSPNAHPVAFSITGTTNSPIPSVTVMYQNAHHTHHSGPSSVPLSASTPPGNMIYDPIRQSLPDGASVYPPAYPQANVSAVRHSNHPHGTGKLLRKYESIPQDEMGSESSSGESKLQVMSGLSQSLSQSSYTPPSQQSFVYETSVAQSGASPSTMLGESTHRQPSQQQQSGNAQNGGYVGYHDLAQSGMTPSQYFLEPISDVITFDSQDIDIGTLGLSNEMMQPWLEYLPSDALGIFEAGNMNGGN